MAVPDPRGDFDRNLPDLPADRDRRTDHLTPLKLHCAKLYGLGYQRAEIARALVEYLAPDDGKPMEQRMAKARAKLRKWENQDQFRDKVFEKARIALDMESPKILAGIARQAKRGKVDAAKLALEITGRYSPKGETQPTQVAVVIGGVPRPSNTPTLTVGFEDSDQDTGGDEDED
jgi:hypothetical protein